LLILTVNTGSSSVKAALYAASDLDDELRRLDRFERSGVSFGPGNGNDTVLSPLVDWLGDRRPDVIGHRVVHGGRQYAAPTVITDAVLRDLDGLVAVDPTHMPQALAAIRAMRRLFVEALEVGCFDTAFHRSMPREARIYALPRKMEEAGIVRYGFHGLSCEYIMSALQKIAPSEATGLVIIAHLGNGSSMTAVRDGSGIETTMGFSPTGGLVMGTRCGDIDPAVMLYLLESLHETPETLGRLVTQQAGMLAVSGISSDMHQLLRQEREDDRAREAVNLYCYQARKFVGALTAALGGLNALVFTGGIGEHGVEVRRRICAPLAALGIEIDPERNARNASVISTKGAVVVVRVIATDEDAVIARQTLVVARTFGEVKAHENLKP
jgi:acetate kinase